MNNQFDMGNPSTQRDEAASEQLFDLLNLSPPGEYEPGSFDINIFNNRSGTTSATSTPPFILPHHSHNTFQQQQQPQQQQQHNPSPFFMVESPVSDINSPVEMLVGGSNNTRFHNNEQMIAQILDQQAQQQEFAHQRQFPQPPQINYQQPPQPPHQQQQQQQQFTPSPQDVPLFNFDSPSQNNLIPSGDNGFYSNAHNNNSNSNLTVISAHSYVSTSQNPPVDQHDLATSLLSPYESVQFGSMTPTHASSVPASPFLSTSPFSEHPISNSNIDDDNLSIYQTIENLNVNSNNNGELELSQTERAMIEKEFIKQESTLKIQEAVHSNRLTEDNLNNNNTLLQATPPITINIQAPEEIAAQTPSLFSASNSQRSTPINSPRNRSRSSSFENKDRPQLGNSLSPSIEIQDTTRSSSSSATARTTAAAAIKLEKDENLLRPEDGEFQRMRHGRRLSNASRSRSRSRSRSKSADSRQSDISDPTKNREKMIELAAPHSNKRTQKHPSVHACHLCDKTFTRPYNLKSHLRTHTDERPFICSTCGKAFARHHDKKRHEDLHTGEKRFQCKGLLYDAVTEWGCHKRFARADALGRHFKTESGRECVRPLLEDHRRRKSIAAGIQLEALKVEEKITDDMLNDLDFNEIFASQMGKD